MKFSNKTFGISKTLFYLFLILAIINIPSAYCSEKKAIEKQLYKIQTLPTEVQFNILDQLLASETKVDSLKEDIKNYSDSFPEFAVIAESDLGQKKIKERTNELDFQPKLDRTLQWSDKARIDVEKQGINGRNKKGDTLLMVLVVTKGKEDIDLLEEVLTDHNPDLNLVDAHKRTALMTAAGADNSEAVELLLKHGANVNLKDDEGNTALMLTIGNPGSPDSAEVLINYPKTDFYLKDNKDKTALNLLDDALLEDRETRAKSMNRNSPW